MLGNHRMATIAPSKNMMDNERIGNSIFGIVLRVYQREQPNANRTIGGEHKVSTNSFPGSPSNFSRSGRAEESQYSGCMLRKWGGNHQIKFAMMNKGEVN